MRGLARKATVSDYGRVPQTHADNSILGTCNAISSSSHRLSSTLATSKSSSTSVKSSSSSSISFSSKQSSSVILSSATSSPSLISSSSSSSPLISLSASSTVLVSVTSSSATSSMVSSTPSSSSLPAPTCFPVPDCQPFTGALTNCVQSTQDKCQSGYQSKCSQVPQIGSVILEHIASTKDAGEACAADCTARNNCVGFVFGAAFDQTYYCNLYSYISSVSTGFGSTWLKVCDEEAASSSSIAVSSSSAVSSSVVTISPTATPSSVQPAESSTSASPSAFPSPVACRSVVSDRTCSPYTEDVQSSCPSGNSMCTSDYIFRCNQFPQQYDLIEGVYTPLRQACLDACTARAECIGAWYVGVNNLCALLRGFDATSVSPDNYADMYLKLCDATPASSTPVAQSPSSTVAQLSTASAPPSSSPAQLSSTSVASSALTTPSSSSSVATPSALPPPPPSPPPPSCLSGVGCAPYSGDVQSSCPAGRGYCVPGYQLQCTAVYAEYESYQTFTTNDVQECLDACTAYDRCPAAFLDRSVSTCVVLRGINLNRNPSFSSTIDTYVKLCDDTPTSSTPVAQLSSISATPSPSPVASSSLVASASASPTPSSCASIPGCTPFAGPLDNICPTADNMCASGYRIRCGISPTNFVVDETPGGIIEPVNSVQECLDACTARANCVAAYNDEAAMGCILLTSVDLDDSPQLIDGFNTYLKLCGGAPSLPSTPSVSPVSPSPSVSASPSAAPTDP